MDDNVFDEIDASINVIWVSTTAYLVFFMQTGFSFLEAGNIRFKNIQNVLVKNLLSVTLGTIIYWLVSFGFSFGDSNDFIGTNYFHYGCFIGLLPVYVLRL